MERVEEAAGSCVALSSEQRQLWKSVSKFTGIEGGGCSVAGLQMLMFTNPTSCLGLSPSLLSSFVPVFCDVSFHSFISFPQKRSSWRKFKCQQ